jgi:hypothetical protein
VKPFNGFDQLFQESGKPVNFPGYQRVAVAHVVKGCL